MNYQNIIVETNGRVGVIRLNRPQALNALNSPLFQELGHAVDEFETNDGIGCMLLTGSEKAFAAGADIKEMVSQSFNDVSMREFTAAWHRVARARKPVVAAVAGYALGGGCELAMLCDIIIAADNAKFGQPEIKLGVIPGIGGTQRLTRAVGKAKAMDLILTGRMMDAAEADRSGLVARVVPAAKPHGRGDEASPRPLRRCRCHRRWPPRRRSTAPTRCHSPRACCSNGVSFIRCSRRKISAKA